ncbi:histidine kinase [Actinosynnema sp. NPDC023794]
MREPVLRTIVTPLPAGPVTVRGLLVDTGSWLVLAAPFLVDLDRLTSVIGVVATALMVPLAARLPLVAPAVATVAAVVDWRYLPAVAVTGYLAGRRLPAGRAALAVFPLVTVLGSVVVLSLSADVYTWLVRVGGLVVVGVFPWLVGRYRRQQVQLVESGWERAARLAERQRIVAEQARLRERARIAHDMHDSLGHQLSLAALTAGSLEVAADLDERHRATATAVREIIAVATERMRDIVDLLRDEDDPAPTTPDGERIGDLVARASAAGVAVELAVDGDVEDLEPLRYRAAYRTGQEAITNATKHAPGAGVSVRLHGLDDEARVVVTNGPPAEPVPSAPSRGGRGLAGLGERVRLAGGTLRAGPHGDGYQVVVRLPRAERALGDPPDASPDENLTAEFDRARDGVRRSLAAALLTPVALGAGLVVVLMGVYAYDTGNSTLRSESFQRLALGTARSAVADVLPDRQVPERGFEPEPPRPPGSTCEYYRSDAGFLPEAFDVYRLCFRDDVLVGKDVLVRTGERAGE